MPTEKRYDGEELWLGRAVNLRPVPHDGPVGAYLYLQCTVPNDGGEILNSECFLGGYGYMYCMICDVL